MRGVKILSTEFNNFAILYRNNLRFKFL